jgi:hypothetical protein
MSSKIGEWRCLLLLALCSTCIAGVMLQPCLDPLLLQIYLLYLPFARTLVSPCYPTLRFETQVVPKYMYHVRRHKLLRRLLTELLQQLQLQHGHSGVSLTSMERVMSQPQFCPLAVYSLVRHTCCQLSLLQLQKFACIPWVSHLMTVHNTIGCDSCCVWLGSGRLRLAALHIGDTCGQVLDTDCLHSLLCCSSVCSCTGAS